MQDSTASIWPQTPQPHLDADARQWLRNTRQLDLLEPRLRITAQKLTQSVQSAAGRVAAIQTFVRRLPFAACLEPRQVTAAEVLRRGEGDCHSKGLLFVALCRAAGIPARLQFVDVSARFLAGLLDEGPEVVTHAVAQVLVNGRWLNTDGYVVDPLLFARAKELLGESGLDSGWGIVAHVPGAWAGDGDCLQQFQPRDVLRCHPPVHDVAQFYAARNGRRGVAFRLKYLVGARLVQRRVTALRCTA